MDVDGDDEERFWDGPTACGTCCTAGVATMSCPASVLATLVRACTAASKLLEEGSGELLGELHCCFELCGVLFFGK